MGTVQRLRPLDNNADVLLMRDLHNACGTLLGASEIFTNLQRHHGARQLALALSFAQKALIEYQKDFGKSIGL